MTSDEGWTIDQFLAAKLEIRQPRSGYRAGSDAVLLAAAVPAKAGETVLDVGAGVGTAGFCLLARIADVSLVGVELEEDRDDAGVENAEKNGFQDRWCFLKGDITAKKVFGATGAENL